MNTHSFKLLYTGGLALNWDDPRSQPSPAHEKLLGYALITRDAKSPKESALNLLKDAKSTSHLLSHSHFFTTPIDTLIKNIGSIEKSEDCDAIKLAFSPYIHQQNPNKEEQEIKEIYEFLCEFTFVPKIDKTSVDVKYSLNL